jgi:hypothetical protein
MFFRITTYNPQLFSELVAVAEDPCSNLPEGVLIGEPSKSTKQGEHGFPTPEVITFAVSLGSSVAINLFSDWLWERIKDRTSKLEIDNREITLSVEEINFAIEQYLRQKRDSQ